MEEHLLLIEDFTDALLRRKDASDDRERASEIGQYILTMVETVNLRRPEIFYQKRGEEYEAFCNMLFQAYSEPEVLPFLEDEDFFQVCLDIRRSGRLRRKRNV